MNCSLWFMLLAGSLIAPFIILIWALVLTMIFGKLRG